MPKSIISSKKDDLSRKITFIGTLDIVHFELLYRIKIKRICKGYSQQELAFLLGKDKDYISDREHLEDKKTYTLPDINKLSFILDDDCRSFIPAKANKNKATYTGSEVRENGKIYHEASIKTGASYKLLFKVEEDDPEVNHFPASNERQLNKLKTLLTTLCEIGYFSQDRTPFEVYGCCSRLVPGYSSVQLVEQAVNHCMEQKRIKRIIKGEYMVFRCVRHAPGR